MANRKISELQSRTPALSDLMLVGDPSSGYSYKCTVTALATIIETDIADGFVTIGTTQTISGAKTFSNNLTLTSVANATTTQTKFLTLNGSNVVNYRTGAEVLADIGGASSSSISGTTNYVAKFTSSSAIGNSQIFDNETSVGINTATPNEKLEVSGVVRVSRTTSASAYLNLTIENGVAGFDARGSIDQVFYTGAIERMRIGFGGDVTISTIANATIDTDKFLVSDSGVLKYRTGAEVLSDIGGASAALYVPYTGATTNVNLGTRTITANGVYSIEGTYVANTYGLYGRNAANNAYNLLVGITGQDKVYIDANASGTIIGGALTLSVINNATIDTDTFLVSDSGVIKYRTGAQLLSDIGAASSSSISGTTNYIPKFTSSSAIGNSVIYEDASGDIGVGTTTPSSIRLNVLARSGYEDVAYFRTAGTNIMARINLIPTGTAVGAINSSANGFAFQVAGSERMRLDASGNLGLGTSSIAAKLDVLATYSSDTGLQERFRDNTGVSLNFGGTGGGKKWIQAQDATGASTYYDIIINPLGGNLGLGVTPSNAYSDSRAFEIGASGILWTEATPSVYNSLGMGVNFYYDAAGNVKYKNTGVNATRYSQYYGQHQWYTAPSGTAGNAISFTQAMTLDASGRLGIGTTVPNFKTHISTGDASSITQPTAGTYGLYIQQNTSGSVGGLYIQDGASNSGNAIFVGDNNGAARFIVNGDGNVGIGTSSPAALFDVTVNNAKTVTAGVYAYLGKTNEVSNYAALQLLQTGAAVAANRTWSFQTIEQGIANAGNISFQPNGGNVGIGTTSPTYKLQAEVSSANVAYFNRLTTDGDIMTLAVGGTNAFVFNTSSSVRNIQAPGAVDLTFATNGSERMRITSGGNVLVNKTNNGTGAVQVKHTDTNFYTGLSVYGTTADNFTSVGHTGSLGVISSTYNSTGSYTPLAFYTSDLERMRITSGGKVLVNTTSDAGDYKLQVNGNGVFVNSGTPLIELRKSGATDWGSIRYDGTNLSLGTFGGNSETLKLNTSGNAEFLGSIKTAAPSGGTAVPWKLGDKLSTAVTLDTGNYIPVEVNGVTYYLALVTLN